MKRFGTKRKRNLGEGMENARHRVLIANFNRSFCKRQVFFRQKILFTKDYTLRSAGGDFFEPFKKIVPAKFSVCYANDIRHKDNRSEQAEALRPPCRHTFFQGFFRR